MISFAFRLSFPNAPRCPICQRDLNPCGFWLVDGLAFCRDCSDEALTQALALEIDAAAIGGVTGWYVRVCGVLFYCPGHTCPRQATAARLLSEHVYCPSVFPKLYLHWAGKRRVALGKLADPLNEPTTDAGRRRLPSSLDDRQRLFFELGVPPNSIDTHPIDPARSGR